MVLFLPLLSFRTNQLIVLVHTCRPYMIHAHFSSLYFFLFIPTEKIVVVMVDLSIRLVIWKWGFTSGDVPNEGASRRALQ
uniref:Uncharacterized protein n=1 Tax=Aegilops tauschii subsp. strangulata TaxID=200361 RepID=A0A453BTF8_AEGTS